MKKKPKMGRPPKKPAEKLSKLLGLKFTEADYDLVKATMSHDEIRKLIVTAAKRKR